ncbi:DMT family transporter [Alkalicoccus urumqiensis]|uniref:EamA family transporter n=1 Tax=Alkalicoccus urumqiensis TaxID=1548213 RepID=A0A2P6MHN2_ALKUR|nr:DMT family transporter [Alkalicoccus urumqiensis]PRO65760.1 EamA family transporter [Alkalicoccus urumqiensis]
MKFYGVILIVIAAVGWGLSGGIGDILMSRGWEPMVISFYRGLIGLVFFSIWLAARYRPEEKPPLRFYIWAAAAGLGVAGNFSFYYFSIQASGVAVAATLMYTAPIFVLLVSFALHLERATWFKCGCIASVMVGIVLLTGILSPGGADVSGIGTAAGLGAGLSYTLFIFGFKNAAPIGRPQTALTVAFAVFCLVLFFLGDRGQMRAVLPSEDLWLFLLLGVVGAGMSFIFYIYGIRLTTPAIAAMTAMVEPVTASLFGVLLGDMLSLFQLGGMAVILLTVAALSTQREVPAAAEAPEPEELAYEYEALEDDEAEEQPYSGR